MRNAQLKTRLYLACLLVLAAGLCSAALVYAFIDDAPEGGEDYVVVNGVAYPVATQQTKRYVRSLEQFGGKASVLFDEFNRWFVSLWRGKALALTIACISTAAAIALFLFAAWLPADRE
jgi:hypothetical protein